MSHWLLLLSWLAFSGHGVTSAGDPATKTIAAPHGLAAITSKRGCATYGGFIGSNICDAAIRAGDLALSWHENAKTLDGYKVYRVDGGRNDLVATTSNGAQPTFTVLRKASNGFDGHCYTSPYSFGCLTHYMRERLSVTYF